MKMESKGLIGGCLCMLIAGSGCVAGKRMTTDRAFRERDSLVVERCDSLQVQRTWKSLAHATLRWEEVALSPPDSNGRQFVERVSRGVADNRQVSACRDTLSQLSRQEDRRLRETVAMEQKESGWSVGRLPVWWVLGGGGVLFLGVWWCDRRKRWDLNG